MPQPISSTISNRPRAFTGLANYVGIIRSVFSLSIMLCLAFHSLSFAQPPFSTRAGDNNRSSANTSETFLKPSNVNQNEFGRLFSVPLDYVVMAQPLYMPNVNIPGQGLHNVVYVVTQADSVYAIDADTGVQLWHASMLNGGTTASGTYLPCGTAPGFNQEGIVGTPVIDPATNTIYLVAKSLLNTTVRHHLHALDIATGIERPGSPVLIQAQSRSNKGKVTVFNSRHQKNRPGLLLVNGVIYMGFGSNYCNDADSGWVLSYNASSLQQLGVFNTSPDSGLVSIWQAGNGLAADQDGNIYFETAESGTPYDVPNGGQTYANSVMKLAPNLTVADYFTPWTVAFLNSHDLDLSSTGTLLLPDLTDSPHPHEMIAGGKEGIVYVLDRDNMGMFSTNDSQIVQEFALVPGTNNDVLFGAPAYWNNTVYIAPNSSPIMAYPLSAGLLGTPLKTAKIYNGGHTPMVSANGTANGILWAITGQLLAFDAVSMQPLYTSAGAPNNRDRLPPIGHFVTQTVANGKVYVGTANSLEIFGLFQIASVTGGSNQTGPAGKPLAAPIKVQVNSPYNGAPKVGATVNFSDGAKGGTFNPASALTDANGFASSTYTVPLKAGTYTLTMSGTGVASVTTTATSIASGAVKIIAYGGAKQTGAAGSTLPKPIIAQARDVNNNGVAGVTINFTSNKGGIVNPQSAVTDVNGQARTVLQLPTAASTVTVTATSVGLKSITFPEFAVAGPAASVVVTGGNNQSGAAGTQLPQALTVLVADQYGNPVPSVNVTFDDRGAGGRFLNPNPAATSTTGVATQLYTLPANPATVTINATVTGVATPAAFTETGH